MGVGLVPGAVFLGERWYETKDAAEWRDKCVAEHEASEAHLTVDELQECEALNRAEANAEDASVFGLSTPSVELYETLMARWQARRWKQQPACRVVALGAALCEAGVQQLGKNRSASSTGRSRGGETWDVWMAELSDHVQNPMDCSCFDVWYHPRVWEPAIFHWNEMGNERQIDILLGDPEYEDFYARAGHLAPPYGPPQVSWRARPQGLFRKKQVHDLMHFRMLRNAVPGLDLSKLSQVLEFGGGTGQAAATLRNLGFNGTHLVFDLPPMLLQQRYWHRYSGIPSFLGTYLPRSPDAVRGRKTVLESSLTQGFLDRLDRKALSSSLLIGTESFTEAAVEVRERFRPLLREFGLILMSFQDSWDGVNNTAYLQSIFRDELGASHDFLSWSMLLPNRFYLIAAHKKVYGQLVCREVVSCFTYNLHPMLHPLEERSSVIVS